MNNIGFGTLKATSPDFKNTLREAFRQGIKHFDTAYSYRDAETILSSVIKEQRVKRESIEITTKVMPVLSFSKKTEVSLKRLKTDYVDNLLIHWPTKDEKLLYSILKSMEKLKDEEKILNIGLSNFPLELYKRIHKDFEITTIQRALSLLWIKDINEEIEYCNTNGIKIQTYSPLSSSLLVNKGSSSYINSDEIYNKIIDELTRIANKKNCTLAQVALSYVFSYNVDTVFLGAANKNNLISNLDLISYDNFDELHTLAKQLDDINTSDNFYKHEW